jgi:hypothetical protein
MNTDHSWNDTDGGKTEVLVEKKTIPVPLCPPQITNAPLYIGNETVY